MEKGTFTGLLPSELFSFPIGGHFYYFFFHCLFTCKYINYVFTFLTLADSKVGLTETTFCTLLFYLLYPG